MIGIKATVLCCGGNTPIDISDIKPGEVFECRHKLFFHELYVKTGDDCWFTLKRHDNGNISVAYETLEFVNCPDFLENLYISARPVTIKFQ